MAYAMEFNIWVIFWLSSNRAAAPLLKPAITAAPPEANAFKSLSSNPNLEIGLIRQSCIVFASAAFVTENSSRYAASIDAVSAFPFSSS